MRAGPLRCCLQLPAGDDLDAGSTPDPQVVGGQCQPGDVGALGDSPNPALIILITTPATKESPRLVSRSHDAVIAQRIAVGEPEATIAVSMILPHKVKGEISQAEDAAAELRRNSRLTALLSPYPRS